jgi:hypothetical protein
MNLFLETSGFWPRVRVRALRAPVFLDSLPHQTGRCAHSPPIAASMLHIYTQNLPSGPNSVRQGRISFHWAKLHPSELHCILLSYAEPS